MSQVTGPMEFELPYPDVELPPGDAPLVLVAPITAQDPELRLVRAALEALAEEPVRVVATTNRLGPGRCQMLRRTRSWSIGSPTRRLMPQAALVVCHGGHGTVARALGGRRAGAVLPGGRRHGGERGAGGLGRRRADAAVAADGAAVAALGGAADPGRRRGSRSGPARSPPGRASNDGAERGAELVEQLAG